MVSFKFLIANALTTATAVATPLVLRSVPQINIDLTTIALQIRRICFTSIIAARGPGLNYLSYDIVYAILATSIAAKNATTDTTNTAAFTEAQCTRLLNATDAGVPGALKVALPYLAAADSKLLESGCWNDSKAALALVKTNLHNFIGNLSDKCPTSAGKNRATAIQTITDNMMENALRIIPLVEWNVRQPGDDLLSLCEVGPAAKLGIRV